MDVREVRLVPVDRARRRIAHGFLATGGETYILDGAGKLLWSYPSGSRDGWVLPDGHVLLALNKGKDHPGGAVVEVDREGKVLFAFEGTQSEVNTVQPLEDGRILLTEAGDRPRLLEVDRAGQDPGRGAAPGPDEGPPPPDPDGPQARQRQLPGPATARQGRPRVHPRGPGRLGGEDPRLALHRDPARRRQHPGRLHRGEPGRRVRPAGARSPGRSPTTTSPAGRSATPAGSSGCPTATPSSPAIGPRATRSS